MTLPISMRVLLMMSTCGHAMAFASYGFSATTEVIKLKCQDGDGWMDGVWYPTENKDEQGVNRVSTKTTIT